MIKGDRKGENLCRREELCEQLLQRCDDEERKRGKGKKIEEDGHLCVSLAGLERKEQLSSEQLWTGRCPRPWVHSCCLHEAREEAGKAVRHLPAHGALSIMDWRGKKSRLRAALARKW